MMASTYLTMDMLMVMLMPMVGITDLLTVMAMVNYQAMGMKNEMDMCWGTNRPSAHEHIRSGR
jgi:hypothetical protein